MRFLAILIFSSVFLTRPARAHQAAHLPVSANRLASKLFNEGYIQLYAYNYQEAEHQFRSSIEVDSSCAMCWWGLGVSIKQQHIERGEKCSDDTLHAFAKGRELAQSLKNWEKTLINIAYDAFSQKTSFLEKQKNYALLLIDSYRNQKSKLTDHLRTEWLALLTDALYYQSLLSTAPKEGHLCGGIVHDKDNSSDANLLHDYLNQGLNLNPKHPGLLHTYIHVNERNTKDAYLLIAAQELKHQSRGNIGHFEHMPNHVYWRRGMYQEALAANLAAIDADHKYFNKGGIGRKGYYYPYHYLHYYQFTNNLYVLMGNKTDALTSANTLVAKTRESAENMDFIANIHDYFMSLPHQTLVRFGDYQNFLKLEMPQIKTPTGKILLFFLKSLSFFHLEMESEFQGTYSHLLQLVKAEPRLPLSKLTGSYLEALFAFRQGKNLNMIERQYRSLELIKIEDEVIAANPNYWYFWSPILLYQMAKQRSDQQGMERFRKLFEGYFPRAFIDFPQTLKSLS